MSMLNGQGNVYIWMSKYLFRSRQKNLTFDELRLEWGFLVHFFCYTFSSITVKI